MFCRTLRQAGLPIGPGQVIDAGQAILQTGIERRDDFYAALRAVLVSDPTNFAVFDQAFHIYFRNPRLLERMMGLLLPTLEQDPAGESGETAMLHQILGLEVGPARVLRAGGVHDRQLAGVVERLQAAERRIQAEGAVEVERPIGPDAEDRPRPIVGVVADRRHQRQAVGGAAQEDHHQALGPVAVAVE